MSRSCSCTENMRIKGLHQNIFLVTASLKKLLRLMAQGVGKSLGNISSLGAGLHCVSWLSCMQDCFSCVCGYQ